MESPCKTARQKRACCPCDGGRLCPCDCQAYRLLKVISQKCPPLPRACTTGDREKKGLRKKCSAQPPSLNNFFNRPYARDAYVACRRFASLATRCLGILTYHMSKKHARRGRGMPENDTAGNTENCRQRVLLTMTEKPLSYKYPEPVHRKNNHSKLSQKCP